MAPVLSDSGFIIKEGPDIFSPKDMIELTVPGVAITNPLGDLTVVPSGKYSFKDKAYQKSLHLVPLEPGLQPKEIPLPKGGEFFWLSDRILCHIAAGETDLEIFTLNIDSNLNISGDPVFIGTIPSKTATNFRFNPPSRHLVFSDNVYIDGDLVTLKVQDEAHELRDDTAYVFDSGYPRHWDAWTGPKKAHLFSVKLSIGADNKWTLASEFNSPLKSTGHHCPVEPFGGTDDFDVSATHIVYTTKDPQLPEPSHTKQNVYIVDILGKEQPRELTSGNNSVTHNPVFNTSGTKVAWLELEKEGYEADKANIVLYDLQNDIRFTLTHDLDRSPETLMFSKEDDFLCFTASDHARVKIFTLPIPPTPQQSSIDSKSSAIYSTTIALTHNHSASGIQPLPSGRILFSHSSFSSPKDLFIVHDVKERPVLASDQSSHKHITRITHFTEKELQGKYLSPPDEFWFKGANDRNVQGWLVKPKGWKSGDNAKWPVVLYIHGGPQAAWLDEWSTMWNPHVIADQGYFVVLINQTGSKSFGQDFVDAITGDWGGKPFIDLIAGWKHVLMTYPEIDSDRAAAFGPSWGGYAINWIQGHPEFGFNFKALVCHDGIFDTLYTGYASDESFFFHNDFAGRPWESQSVFEKFNPRNFVSKWSIPELLIHGCKDFRLPETESIAPFNALQQLGVPSRLPDENHLVLKPGNSLRWHLEVLRWLDQFVGHKES